jgi:replicative DNA helicase
MAKLYNSVVEAVALKALCSKDPKVSGYFFSQVREEFFYNDESKEAFNRILDLFRDKGHPPAFRLLIEDLALSEDTREFLKSGEIGIVKTLPQAEQAIAQLDSYRKTRELFSLATGILKKLERPRVDVHSLTSRVADRLARIQSRRTTEDSLFHLGKDSNAMALVEKILYEEDQDQCIPTGFKTFDDRNGGFFRGGLVVLASTSGGGKSLLANQLCMNMSTIGYKVALVPLEMTESEMFSRTMSSKSGLSSLDIFLKRLATGERDAIYKKMRRWDKQIAAKNGRYTIYKPKEDLSIEELIASLHALNSDVLMVDYITLLKDADGDEQWKKLGQIARFCKIYAETHNKVIVLLAQLTDDGKVRYSQAIKEHANLAWTWVATKDSRDRGYMNVELLKARNQDMRPFTLKVDYGRMSVSDLEPEELKALDVESRRKDRQKASADQKQDKFKPTKKSAADHEYLPDLSE